MVIRYITFILLSVFTFSTSLYASTAAGVLPIFDDGTVLVGLEKRKDQHGATHYVWSDFGGKQDRNDKGDLAATALREGNEESAYSLHLSYNAVANSPYVDHIHKVGSYRMYLVRVHGHKPSIQTIKQNAHRAIKKHGRRAHVEKIEWRYVDARQLLNAANNNAPLPGTNQQLFGPLKANLKKPVAQATLKKVGSGGRAPHKAPAPAHRGHKQTKKHPGKKHHGHKKHH